MIEIIEKRIFRNEYKERKSNLGDNMIFDLATDIYIYELLEELDIKEEKIKNLQKSIIQIASQKDRFIIETTKEIEGICSEGL